ncbi:MAG: hypothetical protein HGA31_05865 [Candidatus Moranbacteria bacterium]|nr:hypothetical protein [Candidatus Moranbacteria bacterium]
MIFGLWAFPVLSRAAIVAEPSFMKDVQSQADIDKLTPAQQEEMSRYLEDSGRIVEKAVPETASRPVGAVDCFDFYRFGSVQVDVTPTIASVVPGIPVVFKGSIRNNNAYPVTDGSVFVKIFRTSGTDQTHTQTNGYPVVDSVFVKDGVNIAANGSNQVTFQ